VSTKKKPAQPTNTADNKETIRETADDEKKGGTKKRGLTEGGARAAIEDRKNIPLTNWAPGVSEGRRKGG